MADTKISDFAVQTTMLDADLLVTAQEDASNKKITWENLRLASNVFPATAVPSADPNTFDDYEEGSWVPEYIPLSGDPFTSVTYNFQYASYTKIGRIVMINCYMRTTALNKGSATAGALIVVSGLPFTVFNSNNTYVATSVGISTGYLSNPPVAVQVVKNVAYVELKQDLGNLGCTVASLGTGGAANFIGFSFSYRAS